MHKAFNQKEVYNEIYMDCYSNRWSCNSLNFFLPTVPTEPLTSGELRLLNLQVAERGEIRLNYQFVVNINFRQMVSQRLEQPVSPSLETGILLQSNDINYGSPGTIKRASPR